MDSAYTAKYSTNIRTVIADTCSGDMRDFLTYLVMDNAEFDSFVLSEALNGWWVDAAAIVEVLTARNYWQLQACA